VPIAVYADGRWTVDEYSINILEMQLGSTYSWWHTSVHGSNNSKQRLYPGPEGS
jgi:hypothetical protein